jgi:hypothetical protein
LYKKSRYTIALRSYMRLSATPFLARRWGDFSVLKEIPTGLA